MPEASVCVSERLSCAAHNVVSIRFLGTPSIPLVVISRPHQLTRRSLLGERVGVEGWREGGVCEGGDVDGEGGKGRVSIH